MSLGVQPGRAVGNCDMRQPSDTQLLDHPGSSEQLFDANTTVEEAIVARVCGKTGRVYYVNLQTGQSSWIRKSNADVSWISSRHPNGTLYYNTTTEETRWSKPKALAVAHQHISHAPKTIRRHSNTPTGKHVQPGTPHMRSSSDRPQILETQHGGRRYSLPQTASFAPFYINTAKEQDSTGHRKRRDGAEPLNSQYEVASRIDSLDNQTSNLQQRVVSRRSSWVKPPDLCRRRAKLHHKSKLSPSAMQSSSDSAQPDDILADVTQTQYDSDPWIESFDEGHQRPYYVHRISLRSSWVKEESAGEFAARAAGQREVHRSNDGGSVSDDGATGDDSDSETQAQDGARTSDGRSSPAESTDYLSRDSDNSSDSDLTLDSTHKWATTWAPPYLICFPPQVVVNSTGVRY